MKNRNKLIALSVLLHGANVFTTELSLQDKACPKELFVMFDDTPIRHALRSNFIYPGRYEILFAMEDFIAFSLKSLEALPIKRCGEDIRYFCTSAQNKSKKYRIERDIPGRAYKINTPYFSRLAMLQVKANPGPDQNYYGKAEVYLEYSIDAVYHEGSKGFYGEILKIVTTFSDPRMTSPYNILLKDVKELESSDIVNELLEHSEVRAITSKITNWSTGQEVLRQLKIHLGELWFKALLERVFGDHHKDFDVTAGMIYPRQCYWS